MAVTYFYQLPATGAVAPAAGQVADEMIVDITADADGDVAAVIPHLMRAIPVDIRLTMILTQALVNRSSWSVGAVDNVNVNLVKLATGGSGNQAAQLRCIIKRTHTKGA